VARSARPRGFGHTVLLHRCISATKNVPSGCPVECPP
jgi:hypothetical protein